MFHASRLINREAALAQLELDIALQPRLDETGIRAAGMKALDHHAECTHATQGPLLLIRLLRESTGSHCE